MIIITNILIAIFGVTGILLAGWLVSSRTETGIKSHLILLGIKLFISTVIIAVCLSAAEANSWSAIILSGSANFIFFHFLEAYFTQKKILKHKVFNV